jgi:hypothetical protein
MLYDDDQVEALVRGMVKGVKQQMSDQSMSVSEWLETNRAPKADPETMTTPTTGTAPLIERLVAALRARYGHTKTGRPDLVASAWRDDAYAILEALGDGIWIEREQARKDISDLMMEDLFEARFEDYLDDKDAFRKRCDDYADAIIKAVEERP